MSLELEKRKKKSSTQRKEEKYSIKLTKHPLVPNFSLEDQFFSDYLTVGNVSEILEFAEFQRKNWCTRPDNYFLPVITWKRTAKNYKNTKPICMNNYLQMEPIVSSISSSRCYFAETHLRLYLSLD